MANNRNRNGRGRKPTTFIIPERSISIGTVLVLDGKREFMVAEIKPSCIAGKTIVDAFEI